MASVEPIKVIILGAGKGGAALIELFTSCAGVKIVGVADNNPNAPGLQQARLLNIPTSTETASLIARGGGHLLSGVTGEPALTALSSDRKPPRGENPSGDAARVGWRLIQDEQELCETPLPT